MVGVFWLVGLQMPIFGDLGKFRDPKNDMNRSKLYPKYWCQWIALIFTCKMSSSNSQKVLGIVIFGPQQILIKSCGFGVFGGHTPQVGQNTVDILRTETLV